MGTTIAGLDGFLSPEEHEELFRPFEAGAHYYAPMDFVLYLTEDVPYRADRVDKFLTLLWHPYEERAVGVKLKGFRMMFERTRLILQTRGVTISNQEFEPLITVFEVLMTAGLGSAIVADAERKRLDERYEAARELIKDAHYNPRELLLAA